MMLINHTIYPHLKSCNIFVSFSLPCLVAIKFAKKSFLRYYSQYINQITEIKKYQSRVQRYNNFIWTGLKFFTFHSMRFFQPRARGIQYFLTSSSIFFQARACTKNGEWKRLPYTGENGTWKSMMDYGKALRVSILRANSHTQFHWISHVLFIKRVLKSLKNVSRKIYNETKKTIRYFNHRTPNFLNYSILHLLRKDISECLICYLRLP